MLRELEIRFEGNAEGRDIWNGAFDVIACDGFVGNVVLKSAEALAEGILHGLKDSIQSSWVASLGGLLARPAMRRFGKKLDYAEYGGAPLLGVDGVIFIGHGRSTPRAIRSGVMMTAQFIERSVNEHIQELLRTVYYAEA